MPRKERHTAGDAGTNSVFVDTSAWIALFSGRDQNHAEADRVFREIIASKEQLFTTNLVLAEVHRLLLHRAGIRAAATALQKIESSPSVRIQFPGADQHQSGKRWLERLREQPVSYTDAVSFSVMETAGSNQAISYDYHFGLAGFTLRNSSATNSH